MGNLDYALKSVRKYIDETQWYYDCADCRLLSQAASREDFLATGQFSLMPPKRACPKHTEVPPASQ